MDAGEIVRSRARGLRARPSLIFEVVLIGVAYWLYSIVRNGVPTQVSEAMGSGYDLYRLEQDLGIAVEKSLNHAVAAVEWLVVPVNYYYATLHFIVTIAVLVWLWRSHPGRYRPLRSVLYATNAIALLGFWLFPLAPPRFLPGYIDTVVEYGTWGTWASADVAAYSNQYAAMPSMHAGWSLWCGLAIVILAKRRWVKALGVAYPIATSFVVVATANHFVLDIIGGWVALGLGFAVQAIVFRRSALPAPWPRRNPAGQGETASATP